MPDKPLHHRITSYNVCYTKLLRNDQETAEQFSKMIGNTTIEETSVSQTKGWGKGVNPLQRNESTSYRGEVLARPEAITSMSYNFV